MWTNNALRVLAAIVVAVSTVSAQSVTVRWDPSPDPAAVGYNLYVGPAPGVYNATVNVGSAVTASWLTSPGNTYCFALKAYDLAAVEGPLSNEACKTIAALAPSPDGTAVPPSASIVDAAGAVWTITADRHIMRGTVWAADGIGDVILWSHGNIYVNNRLYPDTNGSWWQWLGNGWALVPNPIATAPPPPVLDTIPPTITLYIGRRTGNNYPLTMQISDDVGMSHVEVWVDGALQVRLVAPTTGCCTWTTKVIAKAAGAHTVTVLAFDSSLNRSETSQVIKR